MKKIKKECFKNMIAGPGLLDQSQLKLGKQSHSYTNKDSILSGVCTKSAHKNSLVGPCYNSDTEDNKQSENNVKDEIDREAKHWQQQFCR
jgi:hypothetical protein